MNFTPEQFERMQRHVSSRAYKVDQIKRAHRSGQDWRSDHPDNIRAKIKDLQELLQEAGV